MRLEKQHRKEQDASTGRLFQGHFLISLIKSDSPILSEKPSEKPLRRDSEQTNFSEESIVILDTAVPVWKIIGSLFEPLTLATEGLSLTHERVTWSR